MPVILADLAKAAGVSISTVSRALNESDHIVNEETRQRILHLARESGYKPNLLARGLRGDRTFTVGIILDNISSPFAPPIVRGIQDELKRTGYSIILINSDWDPAVEAESVRTFIARPVDGIIFVDTWLHSANEAPPPSEKPYVFVNRLFGAADCNCIGPDDRYGARLATEHLARLGHRRIAFINGPEGWEASVNRLAGYQDALAAYGLPFDRILMRWGTWEVRDGYRATKELMALPNPPTAIFAANDFMAIGAIYSLQDMRQRVPADVAVVGYDDREVASMVRPALTTVTLPCYEMGQAAARLLLSPLEDQDKPVTAEKVRGRLIVRESCGAEEVKEGEKTFWAHTTPRRLLYEAPKGWSGPSKPPSENPTAATVRQEKIESKNRVPGQTVEWVRDARMRHARPPNRSLGLRRRRGAEKHIALISGARFRSRCKDHTTNRRRKP